MLSEENIFQISAVRMGVCAYVRIWTLRSWEHKYSFKSNWKMHAQYNVQIKIQNKDVTLRARSDFERFK